MKCKNLCMVFIKVILCSIYHENHIYIFSIINLFENISGFVIFTDGYIYVYVSVYIYIYICIYKTLRHSNNV